MEEPTLTNKMIRQFLVELTKQRAIDLLNYTSDNNADYQTLTLIGVSKGQIDMVRSWINNIVVPLLAGDLSEAIRKEAEEQMKEEATKKEGKSKGPKR